jgi:hypothetical protein
MSRIVEFCRVEVKVRVRVRIKEIEKERGDLERGAGIVFSLQLILEEIYREQLSSVGLGLELQLRVRVSVRVRDSRKVAFCNNG